MRWPDREKIDRVEVLDSGELLVGLAGAGNAAYQHIYRAAAGVSWEPSLRGFKSTPMREWSAARWFAHIVTAVRGEFGLELVLAEVIDWRGVSDLDRRAIEQAASHNSGGGDDDGGGDRGGSVQC